jgi:bacillithiol system protein YtxJ
MNWIELKNIEQLEEIKKNSFELPVLIFKHSTRCGVSKASLRMFENSWNFENKIAPYFLDLLNYREISNAIAETFGVTHQSPQILLIRNGECVYNASHESIDASDLTDFVNNA